MKDEEQDEMQGLAAQRAALEEMSQTLLGKLQVMVAEQEERSREFAERAQVAMQETEPAGEETPAPEPPMPPPLVREAPKPAPPRPRPEQLPRIPAAPGRAAAPDDEQEGKIGAGSLFFAALVIFILVRSCS